MTDSDFITNPKFKKVSSRFRYYDPLTDSDVSEDYDIDAFFEGKCPEDMPMEMEGERRTEAESGVAGGGVGQGVAGALGVGAGRQHMDVGGIGE